MLENEVFDFQLSKVLEYTKKGTKVETATIIMRAPTMPEFNEASRFGQIFTQAFMDSQKWSPDKEKEDVKKKAPDKEIKPSEVRLLLFASDRNIDEIAKRFRALACRVCTLDEEGSKLKDSHMDKLSLEDFTNMMCTYAANFTYPSLFNDLADKEGES